MLGLVFFVIGIRALDDAAGAAGVIVEFLPQAFFVGFEDGFAGNLGSTFKPAAGEVAGGQTASLIQNIDQHCRAITSLGRLWVW